MPRPLGDARKRVQPRGREVLVHQRGDQRGASRRAARGLRSPAPAGDGSYIVYVAGASGRAARTPGVAAVQAELDLRKPITDSPVVTAAASSTITVAGTIRFKSASTGAEQIAVDAAIAAYVNGLEMPDGDTTTVDPQASTLRSTARPQGASPTWT